MTPDRVVVPRVPTTEMVDAGLRFLPNLPRVCMEIAIANAIAVTPAPATGDALTWREEIAKHDAQPEGLGELPEHWLDEIQDDERVTTQYVRNYAEAYARAALRRPVVVDAAMGVRS